MGGVADQTNTLGQLLSNAKPYLLMVALQFGMAGNYIFSKDVFNHGMSRYVFIVYRNAMATVALAPFAFFIERKDRPKITLPVFLQILLLGLLEPVLNQSFNYLGMQYTSASFTSCIVNAVPSITFVLAVIARLEKLKMNEVRSQAKVIGTLISFGGALLMAIYKGPAVNLFHSASAAQNTENGSVSQSQQIAGVIFILIGCVALSCFYILQSVTVKRYPAELSLATLICLAGTVETTIVALAAERHSLAWAIGLDIRLYAPLYTGIVTSGIAYYIQGLVSKLRGAVFTASFNPLCMIIVTALGSLILGEQLYLGSIIGGTIIAVGLYAVVWGKAKDLPDPKVALPNKEDPKVLPITTAEESEIDNNISEKLEKHQSTEHIL